VIEISDKPGEEETEPAFKVSVCHPIPAKQLAYDIVLFQFYCF